MMGKTSIFWAVALLLLASPAWAAEQAARVTASVGSTFSGGDALEMREGLADGAELETGDDGNCSLLLDDDTLMEVCGGTALKLDRKGGRPDGQRIVRLDKGEIRMVLEPRGIEKRIEIHTPAAIATILGAVLHVSVDALGVTTITSAANQVWVASSDPNVQGDITLGPGEQLIIYPGQAPPKQPTKLTRKAMSGMAGCPIDFHAVSLAVDRGAREAAEIEEATIADAIVGDLPGVGLAQTGPPEMPQEDPRNPSTDPPYTPVDTFAEFLGDAPTGGGGFPDPPPPEPGGGGFP